MDVSMPYLAGQHLAQALSDKADREAEIARLVDERDKLRAQRDKCLALLAETDYFGIAEELQEEWGIND